MKAYEAALHAVRILFEYNELEGILVIHAAQHLQFHEQQCFISQHKNYLSTFIKLCI